MVYLQWLTLSKQFFAKSLPFLEMTFSRFASSSECSRNLLLVYENERKKRKKNPSSHHPPSPQSCRRCNQPMRVGDPAVYAERAGYDKLWHPACFVCCTCDELLVDMIYFWKRGKLYCGRHYGDSEKPRCAGCDEVRSIDRQCSNGGRDGSLHTFSVKYQSFYCLIWILCGIFTWLTPPTPTPLCFFGILNFASSS